MRIGVKLDNYGPDAGRLLHAARVADEAGFSAGWVSDRLINPAVQGSAYPFTPDQSVPWPSDVDFYEATISMGAIAAVTERMEIAAGVIVLSQRNPAIVAKQMASLDALSGGRIVCGVGVGWMAEEFEAVGAPFEHRGARADEGIQLMRNLWQGVAPAFDGRFYQLPEGTHCFPKPSHDIPIIIGGMTKAALQRAGRLGDGWLGIVALEDIDADEISAIVRTIRSAASSAGRDPSAQRYVLSIPGDPAGVAEVAPAMQSAGIDELMIHADLEDVGEARASLELVAGAVAA